MLVACRLAGLSALVGHYAGLNALPQQAMRRGRVPSVAFLERCHKAGPGKALAVPLG